MKSILTILSLSVIIASAQATVYDTPLMTYTPSLPVLGEYSVPGVCLSIHTIDDYTVVLQNNERIGDAANRLKTLSAGVGGIIQVPWDTELTQCDTLRTTRNREMDKITLSGVLGPEGEMPRFYCRAEKLGGTIPKGEGGGVFWFTGPTSTNLIENIHVDGYGNFINVGGSGKVIVRNNYMHHSTNNGITKGKNDPDDKILATGAHHEFCGNEFSYSGQGNAKHTFYITSSWVDDAFIDITLVDNLLHSCNWSSCYKSASDSNTLINNKFYKTLKTDPSFKVQYSQMLVDIASCAQNEIHGNYFQVFRPEPRRFAGGIMIGIRNRKGNFGCHRPLGYTNDPDTRVVTPNYDSEFWSHEFWSNLAGEKVFKTNITDNIFEGTGNGGWKSSPIVSYGTYPNRASKLFGPACLLESPEMWYERHGTFPNDNLYINIPIDRWYKNSPPGNFDKKCGLYEYVDRRDFVLIFPGSNEMNENGKTDPSCNPDCYLDTPPIPTDPSCGGINCPPH